MYHKTDGRTLAPGPFIYFVSAGPFVKVGWTSGSVDKRLHGIQVCNPSQVFLLAVIEGSKADELEWHVRLEPHWVRGEWFKLNRETRKLIEPAIKRSLKIHHASKGTQPSKRTATRRLSLFAKSGVILRDRVPSIGPAREMRKI